MQANASFYAVNATDYPVIDDRLRKVIALALEGKPRSVLDIGCGRGTLIEALRERAPEASYVGIELSEPLARLAAAKNIRVIAQDLGEPLPFEPDSFDTIVMGEVIEHLYDPDAALDSIHRVLAPGGRLIVTTPNLACWINRILVPAGIQPIFTETSTRKKYGRRFTVFGQNSTVVQGHIRVMTTTALVELLRDRGFALTKLAGAKFCDLERNRFATAVDGFFTRFPTLASNTIAVVRKL